VLLLNLAFSPLGDPAHAGFIYHIYHMPTPAPTIPAEVDLFLENTIKEAHGDKISPGLKTAMKKDLFNRMQNHIMTSLLQALPNDSAEPFDALMQTGPDQVAVHNFFIAHIPNLPEVTARAMMEFRTVYIGGVKS